MIILRIDFKNRGENLPLTNQLLRLLVALYIIATSGYLLYKLFTLPQQHNVSAKEWAAVIINAIIIVVLARQLLRLNNKKFIVVTDEFVKYSIKFPWPLQLNWEKIKTIQFGYSSVRFITKTEKKHRFYYSNATEEEKLNLRDALTTVAKKHDIEFMQPI